MRISRSFVLYVCLVASAAPLAAQNKATAPPRGSVNVTEAIELTNGWAMLAEGRTAEALVRADRVLAANPRSVAAFVLAVETEVARGAWPAALTRYERWIGSRPLEESSILRRIAVGVLRELGDPKRNPATRLEALRALAEDGDGDAIGALHQGVKAFDVGDATVLAAMGDETAVKALIAETKKAGGPSPGSVEALGRSGSALAVPIVAELVSHRADELRAAAAEALGRLGSKFKTVDHLKTLLKDPKLRVQVKAAGALLSLGDVSGLKILQDLAAHENPQSRLIAAQALAAQPSTEWQEFVRQLTGANLPEVRVGAARLLMPYQPEVAKQVLEASRNDPNLAIRGMAAETLAESLIVTDLTVLRKMLRDPDPQIRVRAADRILDLVQ